MLLEEGGVDLEDGPGEVGQEEDGGHGGEEELGGHLPGKEGQEEPRGHRHDCLHAKLPLHLLLDTKLHVWGTLLPTAYLLPFPP